MPRWLWGAIAAVLFAAAALAAEPSFPPLAGRVVDEAGILSASTRDALTQLLAQHEQQTRQQVVVVTLKSLQGETIEDYGYRLGRFWGIGEKGRDTGALLIVAPAEHKVRIEVGYGLEDRLTDAISRTIIEQVILPAFRRGDVDGGIRDGVVAMLRDLGGSPAAAGAAASAPSNPRFDPAALSWILFIGLMALRVLWRLAGGGRRHTGIWYMGGSSGGGSSGGGFSDGGFSGGGGSFGGGGASGSW
ncbi:MAG TPA: TPM domain-containing protein [Stellaceae bacterium]|nr:TPM domain-containing protein [Stellaceae bacterium]